MRCSYLANGVRRDFDKREQLRSDDVFGREYPGGELCWLDDPER
jgi:hypothetical protein